MKLETVNGSGNLSIIKEQQQPTTQLQQKVESMLCTDEQQDDADGNATTTDIDMENDKAMLLDAETDDAAAELTGGGKKKGVRKKRSLNWEEAERCLLVEVIKSKVSCVENRQVDAKSIKAKRLAWLQITKQFNANNFRHRSLEQIQVQWRSMKNSAKREYQQKHSTTATIDALEMIEFMEEMQKQVPNGGTARNQTRAAALLRKELLEIDEEDTPLASLPTSTNTTSEDTLQSSTMALPSPPTIITTTSTEGQQSELLPNATEISRLKKSKQTTAVTANTNGGVSSVGAALATNSSTTTTLAGVNNSNNGTPKQKRQRRQNSSNSEAAGSDTQANIDLPLPASMSLAADCAAEESKYKRQLFEVMKRSRLNEIDFMRLEHEQKLHFNKLEQELKLGFYKQQEELKLSQLREEHETRMRHWQQEHEARMRVYTLNGNKNVNAKFESA